MTRTAGPAVLDGRLVARRYAAVLTRRFSVNAYKKVMVIEVKRVWKSESILTSVFQTLRRQKLLRLESLREVLQFVS